MCIFDYFSLFSLSIDVLWAFSLTFPLCAKTQHGADRSVFYYYFCLTLFLFRSIPCHCIRINLARMLIGNWNDVSRNFQKISGSVAPDRRSKPRPRVPTDPTDAMSAPGLFSSPQPRFPPSSPSIHNANSNSAVRLGKDLHVYGGYLPFLQYEQRLSCPRHVLHACHSPTCRLVPVSFSPYLSLPAVPAAAQQSAPRRDSLRAATRGRAVSQRTRRAPAAQRDPRPGGADRRARVRIRRRVVCGRCQSVQQSECHWCRRIIHFFICRCFCLCSTVWLLCQCRRAIAVARARRDRHVSAARARAADTRGRHARARRRLSKD
jgi:hypothetical protein